jgi:glyceraldehyde-3-phosphate dehydrogenase/erythrose-4-phosphate dehydrogenase
LHAEQDVTQSVAAVATELKDHLSEISDKTVSVRSCTTDGSIRREIGADSFCSSPG